MPMEECCDICGNVGFAEALVTCSRCQMNCEHMYCMRILLVEPQDYWHCDDCEASSKPKVHSTFVTGEEAGASQIINSVEVTRGAPLPAESEKLLNVPRKGVNRWEKKVVTGKTKYLCVNEAIKLSSGVEKYSKPSKRKVGVNKSELSPIRPQNLPLSFSSQKVGNMEISKGKPKESKQITEMLRSLSSLQPSHALRNKHVQKEQPTKVKLPQTNVKSSMKKSFHVSASSSLDPPVITSGGNKRTTVELGTCIAENVNNNLLPDVEQYSETPALDALWKGSFIIQDAFRHEELNHLQAHPPSRVHRKLYEFTKELPKVLNFQVIPLTESWINLFQDCSPDRSDIGLYFFPSDGERLQGYISLLELISVNKWSLKQRIADVELLVFTSELLPADCQRWDGKYFLWGVCHHRKQDPASCCEFQLSVQPSEETRHGRNQVDNNEEVDMDIDIDMIGGVYVGKEEVALGRGPVREIHTIIDESATPMASPGSHKQVISTSRRAVDSVTMAPSPNVKMEPYDGGPPPGFSRPRVPISSEECRSPWKKNERK